MDSVVATVSGYHGSVRFKLIKLISQSGASYVGAMNPSTTHLVCYKFEGKKYELAKKFKTIVVNHRWIEDCIKQGRRVSERPYMKHCGFVMGPLLLETPVAADEVRSVLGEVSTTGKFSKKPVINIESDDSGEDDFTESWLLKENPLPDVRQNKDRSNRSRKKDSKRCSRQDVSLTNRYCLDEPPSFCPRRIESDDVSRPFPSNRMKQKRRITTISEFFKGSDRLMHRNISNELKSLSDSEEDFQHTEIDHNNVDICEPSERHESRKPNKTRFNNPAKRRSLILEDSEMIEEIVDLGTSNHQNYLAEVSDDSNGRELNPDKTRFHNPAKRRTLILEDSETIEDIVDLGTSNHQDNLAEVDEDSNKRELNPRLSTQVDLSCVICWTDFSSTRGVLACGHRFCFSCIQNWADHMASMKKVSTCPLCKADFYSIQKMEDTGSSDQKIYSQTIPNNHSAMDVYILPVANASAFQTTPPPRPVCHLCSCREPEELLISCHRCQIRCVHSYCLDPPQFPWVCVQCKDLRMHYFR